MVRLFILQLMNTIISSTYKFKQNANVFFYELNFINKIYFSTWNLSIFYIDYTEINKLIVN